MEIGNLSIIGDSCSTYENWIPKEYQFWYNHEWYPENGVNTAEKMWWHLLLQEPCARLVMNDCIPAPRFATPDMTNIILTIHLLGE